MVCGFDRPVEVIEFLLLLKTRLGKMSSRFRCFQLGRDRQQGLLLDLKSCVLQRKRDVHYAWYLMIPHKERHESFDLQVYHLCRPVDTIYACIVLYSGPAAPIIWKSLAIVGFVN